MSKITIEIKEKTDNKIDVTITVEYIKKTSIGAFLSAFKSANDMAEQWVKQHALEKGVTQDTEEEFLSNTELKEILKTDQR